MREWESERVREKERERVTTARGRRRQKPNNKKNKVDKGSFLVNPSTSDPANISKTLPGQMGRERKKTSPGFLLRKFCLQCCFGLVNVCLGTTWQPSNID